MGEQSGSAIEVVFWVFLDDKLEVGDGEIVLLKCHFSQSATVEGVNGIGTSGNRAVETGFCFVVLLVFEIQGSEFFQIRRRWIVLDERSKLVDSAAPWEHLELIAQKSGVGNHFD